MSTELSLIPAELVRQSTDIASLCKQIVVASAVAIQGRKYVRVEGWQSIATAHGCVASARDVKRVEGGMSAIGEIRRMQDGQVIATAEGFVGEDETTWYGGESEVWDAKIKKRVIKKLPKRLEYAIRAMAQTRAISRACRSCFAHVVVLMDAGLETTPAEEIPERGDYDNGESDNHDSRREPAKAQRATSQQQSAPEKPEPKAATAEETAFADDQLPGLATWRDVVVHPTSKTLHGKKLGELSLTHLKVIRDRWIESIDWTSTNPIYYTKQDLQLKAAVLLGIEELEKPAEPAKPAEKEPEINRRLTLLAQVRELMTEATMSEGELMSHLQKGKQCHEDAKKLADIPDDDLELYVSQWPQLMEAWGAKPKKGARK